ncbi:MAG: hypothetical protein HYT36_03850 [Candidatus Staskawiczbacteria bacterium]|nr:hypothetical protein [Candidatus Staskawiczbacteria bacterium]
MKYGLSVCAITKKYDLILMKQSKYGNDLEFPAGVFDTSNESEIKFMAKSLVENTGYKTDQVKVYKPSYFMPIYALAEFSAVAVGCEFICQKLDDPERGIKVVEMPQEEFFRLILDGTIISASTKITAFMALAHADISLKHLISFP